MIRLTEDATIAEQPSLPGFEQVSKTSPAHGRR
jgi:hypothetical protein